MPVVIGRKPESTFADPMGLLGDCHRRVELFLGVLVQVTSIAQGGPLNEEQRKAWENALRYFRESAPKHTADEEESLFPRIRAVGTDESRAVLAKVEALEADHDRAAIAHEEVERLGSEWLTQGTLSNRQVAVLQARVTELADLYRDHIALEDREVFPTATRILSAADKAAIGEEMAARRGLTK